MSKYKVGDKVLFLENDKSHKEYLTVGKHYSVFKLWIPHYGLINDVGTITYVDESQINLISGLYKNSNRYKLQQAIKKTGFHAEKLSLASNHAKTYFTGFTAESRFNSRGDITKDRLNSLLTTLAFAERELLGVGAKTVDDVAVDEPLKEKEVIVNVTEMKNQYYDDSKSNDLYSNYFESASKRNQSKRDAKVKNFLIAFLVVVVLLALWFLFK